MHFILVYLFSLFPESSETTLTTDHNLRVGKRFLTFDFAHE